ncbi:Unknown protein, partial [Striga hermonthica]
AVENGWTLPLQEKVPAETKGGESSDGKSSTTKVLVEKPRSIWTDNEKQAEEANFRALYAIMSAVDPTRHKIIIQCTTAQEAWRILERQFEGTNAVKTSKLQRVSTELDDIRMREDETIDMYYAWFCDLVNQSVMLGELVPEARQVQKLMRTLPDRFGIKITALESFQRIQKLGIDDLLSELRTFKINHGFDSMRISKGKRLALKAKNVSKLKKFQKKRFQGNKSFEGGRNQIQQFGERRSGMQLNKFQNANQGVKKDQCRECKGFGHFQKECPNFKKKNKTFKATWSDSSDDEEEESEMTENSNYSNNSAKFLLNEYNYFTSSVHLNDNVCLSSILALKSTSNSDWYFDSECSRHMTGLKSNLTNIMHVSSSSVTFGDGAKNKVLGIGCLNVPGLPKLKNVLLVQNLKANLLSISQLCDQGLYVNFTKTQCHVSDQENKH